MNWVDEYVGIPFQDRGRTRQGLDCWGLFRLIQEEVFNIKQPSYDGAYGSVREKEVVNALVEAWPDPWVEVPLGQERPGDGVLMYRLGEYHVGVVVGPGRFIHVEHAGAVVEQYTALKHRRHLLGFYRYVGGK